MLSRMLLRYCLDGFEMVPVAPVITGITSAFTFHMCWISFIRSLYFRILSASFFITFLSPEIATSINVHVPVSLSWIMMPSLLVRMVLFVCSYWFHNMLTLPSWLVSNDCGTAYSFQCSLFHFTPVSLHLIKCGWVHTLSCLFMYCSFVSIGHADMMCSTVSSNCLRVCVFCLFLFVIFLSHYVWFLMPDLVLLLLHSRLLLLVLPSTAIGMCLLH